MISGVWLSDETGLGGRVELGVAVGGGPGGIKGLWVQAVTSNHDWASSESIQRGSRVGL